MFPLAGLLFRVEKSERVKTHNLLLNGSEKVADVQNSFRQIISVLRIDCVSGLSLFENTIANSIRSVQNRQPLRKRLSITMQSLRVRQDQYVMTSVNVAQSFEGIRLQSLETV